MDSENHAFRERRRAYHGYVPWHTEMNAQAVDWVGGYPRRRPIMATTGLKLPEARAFRGIMSGNIFYKKSIFAEISTYVNKSKETL